MDSDSQPHRFPTQIQEKQRFKSGFVAIVGAPNVGKSTLLNQLLGQKVAIVTPKPQTTRKQVRGILSGENYQIVFVDTPGIHESKRLLNKVLVKWATSALEDVDIVILVVDVTRRQRGHELVILDLLKRVGKPVIIVLNKIDRVAKETLLPIIDHFKGIYSFEAIVPVSAKYNDGVDIVLDEILRLLDEGPKYYDGDMITDQMNEEFVAELIREKIFLLAEEEIPYSTAVQVERMEEVPAKNLARIFATVYVERPSQKKIIIGKGGRFIKKVGQLVREELERFFGKKIYIDIWVKVLKDWSRDEKSLKRLGLSFD